MNNHRHLSNQFKPNIMCIFARICDKYGTNFYRAREHYSYEPLPLHWHMCLFQSKQDHAIHNLASMFSNIRMSRYCMLPMQIKKAYSSRGCGL